jgi:hypothetical protein
MKRTHISSIALALFSAAALFALPASLAREKKLPAKNVTFTKDVAPILFKSCAGCHRTGEAAPMSLLSYKEARPWAKSIREKVITREMPPWHADPHIGQFRNDRRLSQIEIDTIAAWVDGGAIEGDLSDLPPAPKFVDGWTIGKPDLIIPIPEEFTLEASGPDEYQYFEVDPGFTEDKYVQMAEARPGNRKIVHHILAFVEAPDGPWATPKYGQLQKKTIKEDSEKTSTTQEQKSILRREGFLMRLKPDVPVYNDGCALPSGGSGTERDGSGQSRSRAPLTGFAPGISAWLWEPGMVKKIPAGSKILFQIHYSKAAGSVEKDRSMIGLIFANQTPEKEIIAHMISNFYFQIPPGADNHRATACWTVPRDIHLVNAAPHMHFRGKAAEIKAIYPDGRSEVLLKVPNYSFSWQTFYYFKQPIALPKGTRLQITGYFDNSAKNRYNPDPMQAVRYGEPTYDEMITGLIEYTVDNQPLKPVALR